jgi:hypothetical protein
LAELIGLLSGTGIAKIRTSAMIAFDENEYQEEGHVEDYQ